MGAAAASLKMGAAAASRKMGAAAASTPSGAAACARLRFADVYLWSMVSTQSWDLVPHFLQHYANQGVRLRNTQIVVDASARGASSALETTLGALRAHGVPNSTVVDSSTSGGFETTRQALLNDFIASRPNGSWVVNADVDEHFSYPCDPVALLRKYAPGREHALCTRMVDRLPPLGRPIPAAGGSLEALQRLFPLCVTLRQALGGNTVKLSLIRARVDGVPVRDLVQMGGRVGVG